MEYNETYFSEILDNYDGSIIVADAKGTILCCTKGTCKLTGLNFDQLLGTTLFNLVDRGIFSNSVIVECIQTQASTQAFLYAHNDPHEGIYAYAEPIFDSDGQLIRVIAFSQSENTSKIYYNRMESIYKKKITESLNYAMNTNSQPFIAESPASNHIFSLAEQIAHLDTNILICGESGTGKEVLAKYIHANSSRKDQIFVPVNCASIPEALIEAELFGYEKGSFTGADKNGKIGLFELANNGTIFLDEIGELPLHLQPKLLRVLESAEIRKLGGKDVKKLNIRILAATNRNLLDMVNQGTFRSDLYYRLNIFPLHLPPLRRRPEDIEPLIYHFCDKYNQKYKKTTPITNDLLTFAKNYDWPGNIRELKNIVQRYVITDGNLQFNSLPEIVNPSLFPMDSCDTDSTNSIENIDIAPSSHTLQSQELPQHKEFIQECERKYFTKILTMADGNIAKVSALTGLHISGIYKKFEKLGIDYRKYK